MDRTCKIGYAVSKFVKYRISYSWLEKTYPVHFVMCSPENIHAHPRKVNRNSKGEGGFKSPIFLTKV